MLLAGLLAGIQKTVGGSKSFKILKSNVLSKILKYSVDTLNIKLEEVPNIKGKKLLANKYDFEFYEMSRFYGVNLFLKILIDKFLSLIFLSNL